MCDIREKRQRQFDSKEEWASKHFKSDCESMRDDCGLSLYGKTPKVESAVSAIACLASFYGPAESAIAHLTCGY